MMNLSLLEMLLPPKLSNVNEDDLTDEAANY